jgi:hypothetical protein
VAIPILRAQQVFRVVGKDREPIAGARIVLSGNQDISMWRSPMETDFKGECPVGGLDLDRVFVEICKPSIGVEPSRLIDLRSHGSSPIEFVFAPTTPISLQLRERAAAAPGVGIRLADSRGLDFGLGELTSNADGIATGPPCGEGRFKVAIEQPGYWRSTEIADHSASGGQIPIQVRRVGSIELTVQDGYGNARSGVEVDLYSFEFKEWTSQWASAGRIPSPSGGFRSDSSGNIRWSALPNGEFKWRATGSGGVVEGSVTVPASATGQATIAVP